MCSSCVGIQLTLATTTTTETSQWVAQTQRKIQLLYNSMIRKTIINECLRHDSLVIKGCIQGQKWHQPSSVSVMGLHWLEHSHFFSVHMYVHLCRQWVVQLQQPIAANLHMVLPPNPGNLFCYRFLKGLLNWTLLQKSCNKYCENRQWQCHQ